MLLLLLVLLLLLLLLLWPHHRRRFLQLTQPRPFRLESGRKMIDATSASTAASTAAAAATGVVDVVSTVIEMSLPEHHAVLLFDEFSAEIEAFEVGGVVGRRVVFALRREKARNRVDAAANAATSAVLVLFGGGVEFEGAVEENKNNVVGFRSTFFKYTLSFTMT